MADRGEERAKIVHAAEEDASDHYPEEDGDPAEDCRLNRAVDRARTGDRGEVVSHQNGCFSGDVVHSVFEFMSGGLALGINAPLFRKPSAVEDVSRQKQENGNDQNHSCIHNKLLSLMHLLRVTIYTVRPQRACRKKAATSFAAGLV